MESVLNRYTGDPAKVFVHSIYIFYIEKRYYCFQSDGRSKMHVCVCVHDVHVTTLCVPAPERSYRIILCTSSYDYYRS